MENIIEFLEQTKINDYIIKQEKSKLQIFKAINNLKLVKLEMLKTYIKIN